MENDKQINNNESRKEKAVRLFKEGYNCSQAVFGAFCDLYDIDLETGLKISASFGGGMGRMREVCGAVTGMFMVAGLETGSADGSDKDAKKHNYDVVRKLADKYKEENGSIICRELLGLTESSRPSVTAHSLPTECLDEYSAVPSERNEHYYKKRPCIKLVEMAVDILEHEFFDRAEKIDDSR